MTITDSGGNSTSSAKIKVSAAGAVGILVLVVAGLLVSWRIAPLLSWDAAALLFGIWTWVTIWPMSGQVTTSHAVREDPSRTIADALVLVASFVSLIAVAVVLASASNAQGGTKLLLGALGVISVVVGWATVHTLFVLRYAELYYRNKPRGVDFAGTVEPSYKDFAYLAFTVGMTFQVSDTGFKTTDFRRAGLRHSLISYLFGTVIVATTINLVAGLTK